MKKQPFNHSWYYTDSDSVQTRFHGGNSGPIEVTLPYDAMIQKKRISDSHTTNSGGFFPGGTYVYTKEFRVKADETGAHYVLEFEGSYANSMVYVNDCFAGKCPHGYSNFFITLDPFLKYGSLNTVKLVARSAFDSRWYSGGGIYRDVNLYTSGLLYIEPEGLRLTTLSLEDELAAVDAAVTVTNKNICNKKCTIQTNVYAPDGTLAASDSIPLTVFSNQTVAVHQKLYIQSPQKWNLDTPHLYSVKSTVFEQDKPLDSEETSFGLRMIQLDPFYGFRINGTPIKFRGACVHHDHGVIGANTFADAEERRVRILKESGFNAIRSSHNPASKSMLDACDRLGMLVMDEAFDMWNYEKTDFDYHLSFQEFHDLDLERMVSKDYNHPSVILYSIGNEIVEAGDSAGAALGREMTEKLKTLDPTRPVLNSVNGIYAARSLMAAMAKESGGDINDVMNAIKQKKIDLITDPLTAKCSEESYAAVDVAGYNYLSERYLIDHELYPNRIILGSENTPKDLIQTWPLVEKYPWLLGNFVWTGWDYLGEAGIGRTEYDMSGPSSNRGIWPWYIAYCGNIDITGCRRPASYFHEILWGLRTKPYICVQHPDHYEQPSITTMWTWNDFFSGWTFPGCEKKPALVEVYSADEEVELFLNGKSMGRKPAGRQADYIARFTVPYEPGTLKAVAYKNGDKQESSTLYTADSETRLSITADKTTLKKGSASLSFITIELTDNKGIRKPYEPRKVSVELTGAGTLLGYGSADPKSEENFFDTTRTTFEGRLLAVVRSGDETGAIRLAFHADGLEDAVIELTVTD